MKRVTTLKFWAASAIIIMLAVAAFGQSDGSITGQVKDSNGASVAGARAMTSSSSPGNPGP